jgi:signal transduction histidine kinase
LQLQRLRTSGAWCPEADKDAAGAFTRSLDRTINDVCSIANGLVPQGPALLSLTEAIRLHAQDISQQTGLEIQVHEVGAPGPLDAGARLLLLRAAREALANVARHARACRVSITFESSAGALRLKVMDDGVGVSPDALSHPGGLSLAGLRDRACAAGGTLQVERNARGGTTLCLQLPGTANSIR